VSLLKPQIASALREAGLLKDGEQENLEESLDRAGLSVSETLNQLNFEMTQGDSSASRVRAAELSLKIRGLMKEAAAPLPAITIVIQDSEPSKIRNFNSILIPREIEAD